MTDEFVPKYPHGNTRTQYRDQPASRSGEVRELLGVGASGPGLREERVSVGSWIAPMLTLILLVGVMCYVAGWVGHSTYRQEYEAQRRADHVLAPVGREGFPERGALPPPVPVVVTVYLATEHPQNGVVVHAHSPASLPASPAQRWAARVVNPVRELP